MKGESGLERETCADDGLVFGTLPTFRSNEPMAPDRPLQTLRLARLDQTMVATFAAQWQSHTQANVRFVTATNEAIGGNRMIQYA